MCCVCVIPNNLLGVSTQTETNNYPGNFAELNAEFGDDVWDLNKFIEVSAVVQRPLCDFLADMCVCVFVEISSGNCTRRPGREIAGI